MQTTRLCKPISENWRVQMTLSRLICGDDEGLSALTNNNVHAKLIRDSQNNTCVAAIELVCLQMTCSNVGECNKFFGTGESKRVECIQCF